MSGNTIEREILAPKSELEQLREDVTRLQDSLRQLATEHLVIQTALAMAAHELAVRTRLVGQDLQVAVKLTLTSLLQDAKNKIQKAQDERKLDEQAPATAVPGVAEAASTSRLEN